MLDSEFDQMSNSLLRGTTSIRGRYKAEAVFDERRSTAGSDQERQKDTSEKRGHVKPVHPCTGLTTRFADGKTWLLCRTAAIRGGTENITETVNGYQNAAVRHKKQTIQKENRLLTRGAVHYTYDEEGNLLREEQSDYYLKRYEYAGFNRMEMSDIINYRDNTHVITDYRYDSFGRRIHTAERTKTGMRTIYDGLSFEVVKEGETFLGTRGITSSATGEANLNNYNPHGSDHTRGTRYYFIRDRGQELRTGKNGEALPDRTKGVRTYLYLNGERVAVNNLYNTNHGQYYYGSDLLGSVKFVTGGGGQEVRRIEYDAFGGIYKGNSPYGLETGYTGKPYDAVTGLSDYGFRDYSSAHARFITEDPIRDGENWFAYVGNNPVNWVDPWGLEAGNCSDTKKQYDKLLSYGITFKTSGYAKHPGTPNSSGQNLYLNKPQDACFLRCHFEANVLRETGFTVHYVKLNNILHQESTFHIAPYVNIGDNSYVIDPLFGGHNGVMNVYTWEKQFQPEKVQFMKGYDETGKPTPNIEVGNSYQYAASKNNKFKAMSIDQFAGYWLNSYGTSGNIKKIEEELK